MFQERRDQNRPRERVEGEIKSDREKEEKKPGC